MVSTRGLKVKFSEGERVLCYEPDPSKAKVLYDSKVLQVVHSKDASGRKIIEYLIHFQGWSSTWDRRVPEDFVLKDTEGNRDLQKELADKSHIKLSIKSNRVLIGPGSYSDKKRKRRLSETIRETIEKERRIRTESDTSSQKEWTQLEVGELLLESLTWPDKDNKVGLMISLQTGTTEDDSSSVSSDVGSLAEEAAHTQTSRPIIPEEANEEENIGKHFPLIIPDALKAVLEKDFYLINEKNKLVNLPSSKSILIILEDYVKFFAMRYLSRSKDKRRSEPKEKDKYFMTLDLCKEVIDGIRICFDFYLHTLLLYPRERLQAEKIKKMSPIKVEKGNHTTDFTPSRMQNRENEECREIKNIKKEKEEATHPPQRPQRVLRSKRPVSEEVCNPAPPEIKDTRTQLPVSSCESGRSSPSTLTSDSAKGTESCVLSDESMAKLPFHHRGISHQLKNWTLLPEIYRNKQSPILLYGSIHLLRLFVKMPEIIFRMNLPMERKKIVLNHLDLFLDYLNLHIQDLFTDANYTTYAE